MGSFLFERSTETYHTVVKRFLGYSNLKKPALKLHCVFTILHTCTEAVYEAVVLERWEFYTDLHQVEIGLQRTKHRESVSGCSLTALAYDMQVLHLHFRREGLVTAVPWPDSSRELQSSICQLSPAVTDG